MPPDGKHVAEGFSRSDIPRQDGEVRRERPGIPRSESGNAEHSASIAKAGWLTVYRATLSAIVAKEQQDENPDALRVGFLVVELRHPCDTDSVSRADVRRYSMMRLCVGELYRTGLRGTRRHSSSASDLASTSRCFTGSLATVGRVSAAKGDGGHIRH
jgi:hypothetical protein